MYVRTPGTPEVFSKTAKPESQAAPAHAESFPRVRRWQTNTAAKRLLIPHSAAADAEAQTCRNERLGPCYKDVVELAPRLAPDHENIFEAFGGKESGARTFPLEQGICCHRRTVDDLCYARLFETRNAAHDRIIRVLWRRKTLEHFDPAVPDHDKIREGSACIDADPESPRSRGRRHLGAGQS